MKIHESAENYLETILVLQQRKGSVRSIDIANELEFSKPSVSVAMKNLRLNGYIEVDAAGQITTDLSAAVKTKNELGEGYGMVDWGGAKAEWNVQAAAFASYVTGKTAAEVAGIAITETTKPADGTDLASSVTISIGGFQALIAKAMQE